VQQPEKSVGIEVGVKYVATLSNQQVFDAPKPLKQAKTKLATLQRQASKQVKGSKNQRKTYNKISRLHAQIACIRKDFLHKLITYKCLMYGANLVLVDQWFPSSKTCSNCGNKKDMPLNLRTYNCPACGISIERDLNASINILNWEPSAARGIAY
jgi:putative transposase